MCAGSSMAQAAIMPHDTQPKRMQRSTDARAAGGASATRHVLPMHEPAVANNPCCLQVRSTYPKVAALIASVLSVMIEQSAAAAPRSIVTHPVASLPVTERSLRPGTAVMPASAVFMRVF